MLNHKGTQTIETKRLILRRFRIADTQYIYDNWTSDPEVTRYMSWTAHKNIEFSRQLIYKWVNSYDSDRTYLWAIVPKQYGHPIGSISLVHIDDEQQQAEVGYCIGRTFWGNGFSTEALQAVLQYAFTQFGFEKITAIHEVENIASGKVLKKCRFRYTGEKKEPKQQGEFVICACYAIIKKEWLKHEKRSIRHSI